MSTETIRHKMKLVIDAELHYIERMYDGTNETPHEDLKKYNDILFQYIKAYEEIKTFKEFSEMEVVERVEHEKFYKVTKDKYQIYH